MRNVKRASIIGLRLLVCCLLSSSLVGAQESTNYRMDRLTVAATADTGTSASYAMTATFAQEGPVGSISRCNDSLLQSTGYWSVLGESPVPVFLWLDRNSTDRLLPDLMWSGSASEFTVYRAINPTDVANPVNQILTTNSCAATDDPPVTSIVYYLVFASGS